MTENAVPPTSKLRDIQQQAVQAYELVQLTRLRLEAGALQAFKEKLNELKDNRNAEEQNLQQELEINALTSEQERAGQLLSLANEIKASAENLLKKAGMAHMLGLPLSLDEKVPPSRQNKETMVGLYSGVQLALTDLRFSIYRLANAFMEVGAWESARDTVNPLVQDVRMPLYKESHTLVCETFLRQSQKNYKAGHKNLAERFANQCLLLDSKNSEALVIIDQIARDRQIQSEKNNQKKADQLLKLQQEKLHEQLENLQLVEIPGGIFLAGEALRKKNVPAFSMGKYPVTVSQFDGFVAGTGYACDPKALANNKKRQDHPVVNVSMNDAIAFCEWLSALIKRDVRLPTEAEWEKASRGTDGRKYPWGNQRPNPKRCNYRNLEKDSMPVGTHSPQGDSPYGCADMAGNVWEWTQERIPCGGSFNNSSSKIGCLSRMAPRSSDRRGSNDQLGFRICISESDHQKK